MADDKYDSDYWAMAEFWFQNLRDQTIGLPRVPGGREFRPVSDGPESQNIEDRRILPPPDSLNYDWTWEQQQNRNISQLMMNSLLRRDNPLGNPASFVGQDPLHRDFMHPMDRYGPDPLR
jgi:hypothetical protein